MQSQLGVGGHALGHLFALDKRDCRRCEQALVQLCRRVGMLAVWDDPVGELFKKAAARQQHCSAQDIEDRVNNGDMEGINRGSYKSKVENGIRSFKSGQTDQRTDDIEAQMDDCGAAGILVGADRGEHGRDAGADVLAHDDGDGRTVADGAGGGKRLQDTDRGGGRLDDAGQDCTGQHAEDRVGEHQKELREVGVIPQTGDRAG